MPEMLESEEAARRLGVKISTLYAYVSRGVVTSYPSPQSRRRLFALEDIERLARKARGGKQVESRLTSVVTAITQIHGDGPWYRGVAATAMAPTRRFEEVAELLWGGAGDGPWQPVALPAPPALASQHLLRWTVVMSGSRDPHRRDLRPEAIRQVARSLIATMIDVLPEASAPDRPARAAGPIPNDGRPPRPDPLSPDPLAGRLARKLSPSAPTAALVKILNAAMVLLADHELATSTIAARVAASTRADLHNVVLAALGTVAGPLHGGASTRAYGLLADAQTGDVEHALSERLIGRGVVPGFGQALYPEGDPRATALLALFDEVAPDRQRQLVIDLLDAAAKRELPPANIDFALAAVGFATGLPPDAGETLFTVARTAGWTAHALEELEESPLRFRARAVYLAPGSPGPEPAG